MVSYSLFIFLLFWLLTKPGTRTFKKYLIFWFVVIVAIIILTMIVVFALKAQDYIYWSQFDIR